MISTVPRGARPSPPRAHSPAICRADRGGDFPMINRGRVRTAGGRRTGPRAGRAAEDFTSRRRRRDRIRAGGAVARRAGPRRTVLSTFARARVPAVGYIAVGPHGTCARTAITFRARQRLPPPQPPPAPGTVVQRRVVSPSATRRPGDRRRTPFSRAA